MSFKIKTTTVTTITTSCINYRVSVNLFNVALFKQEYIFASHFLLRGLDGRSPFYTELISFGRRALDKEIGKYPKWNGKLYGFFLY